MSNGFINRELINVDYGGKSFGIQLLRAVCALMVFLSHYTMGLNQPNIISFRETPFAFLVDGGIAVSVFFVLSGFFYFKTKELTVEGYFKSVLHKVLHIFPAHIVVLLCGIVLCNQHFAHDTSIFTVWGNSFWNINFTWTDFLRDACCILPSQPERMINPSTWYLEFEVWFFILMPLLVGLYIKFPWRYALVLFLAIMGILAIGLGMRFLVFNLMACCLDAVARKLTLSYDFKFLQNMIFRALWLIVSILLLVHSYLFDLHISTYFMTEVGAAMLIIALWKVEISRIKSLEFLGNISYEFYLVQQVALIALRPIYINLTQYLLVSFGVSVAIAWLLNNFVTKKINCMLR